MAQGECGRAVECGGLQMRLTKKRTSLLVAPGALGESRTHAARLRKPPCVMPGVAGYLVRMNEVRKLVALEQDAPALQEVRELVPVQLERLFQEWQPGFTVNGRQHDRET